MTSPLPDGAADEGPLSRADLTAFRRDGYVVLPALIGPAELDGLRASVSALDGESAAHIADPDYSFATGAHTAHKALWRVYYAADKCEAVRTVIAHPVVLAAMEQLIGPNFVPTHDTLIIKAPGEGTIVPYHRDEEVPFAGVEPPAMPVIDIFLDDAGPGNCVWMLPGSHLWTVEKARARTGGELNPTGPADPVAREFLLDGAEPLLVSAGDVVLHHQMLVHGSPQGRGNALRRTLYLQYTSAEFSNKHGPNTEEYFRLKQQILLECIKRRQHSPWAAGEAPYRYAPKGRYAPDPCSLLRPSASRRSIIAVRV